MNCRFYWFSFVLKANSQVGKIFRKQHILRLSCFFDFGTVHFCNGVLLSNTTFVGISMYLRNMSHY